LQTPTRPAAVLSDLWQETLGPSDSDWIRGFLSEARCAGMSSAELLGRSPFFAELDPETLEALAAHSEEKRYKRGERLFDEGDEAEHLFVMVEGLVKILVSSQHGDEMVLDTMRPPESFGELALIDGGPRSASAEAIHATRVLVISRANWLELIRDRPALRRVLLTSLGAMIRRLTEQAADLVMLDVHSRVAKLLLVLAEERGRPEGEGLVLELEVTQSDLADMVGGSRQTVNQALHGFERQGYLELRGKQILIKSPDDLRRLGTH
jgi:CRP/FNR family transcriptional regulator, cyclic AMP receptor protein